MDGVGIRRIRLENKKSLRSFRNGSIAHSPGIADHLILDKPLSRKILNEALLQP